MTNKIPSQAGFTLVEMAIVLVIVALLIGGVLAPLSTQKEQERRKENQQLLEQAREALLGYAAVNGYLPCPDTDGDGLEDSAGGTCGPATAITTIYYPADPTLTGRLPWATLGIDADLDPWGDRHFVRYTVHGVYVSDTLSLTSSSLGPNQLDIFATNANCGTTTQPVALDVPAVIWTTAKNFYYQAPTSSADEIVNNTLDNCFIVRDYNTIAGQEFDDQVVWLSRNILFNRMITAGKLP